MDELDLTMSREEISAFLASLKKLRDGLDDFNCQVAAQMKHKPVLIDGGDLQGSINDMITIGDCHGLALGRRGSLQLLAQLIAAPARQLWRPEVFRADALTEA